MTNRHPSACHNADRIRALNDAHRRRHGPTGTLIELNDMVVTGGVIAKETGFILRALHAVRTYSDFNPNNDPYGEHDFGAFDLDGERLFWKIDYYDTALKMGSPCPADPTQTRRVLTIMLADEY